MSLRDALAFYRDTATLAFAVYRGAQQRTKQGAHMQHLTDDERDAILNTFDDFAITDEHSDAERDALLALDTIVHPIAQRLRFPERDNPSDAAPPECNPVCWSLHYPDAHRKRQHPSHPDYQPLGEPIAEYDGKPIHQCDPGWCDPKACTPACAHCHTSACRARRAAADRDRG